MQYSTATKLPNPFLQSHVEMIDAAIQPLADRLSRSSPFVSAGMFLKDGYYTQSADTACIVNTPLLPPADLEFTERSIRGHRIDLLATTLGKTFASQKSSFEASRVNPRHHLVWGTYAEPNPGHPAVLQLVFDRKKSHLIDEEFISDIVRPLLDPIWQASRPLIYEAQHMQSLADELMLGVPVTPNAYVVTWDIVGSTNFALSYYPQFRHYLNKFETAVKNLSLSYDAEIISYKGDGQNIVLRIPDYIDRSDLRAVGAFGRQTVLPFTQHLLVLHDTIAARYFDDLAIRTAVGLGHIERSFFGETTGPVFWEVASKLRQATTPRLALNPLAQRVFML